LQPIPGSRGVTSEIVIGKRSIMKEQAKRLGAFSAPLQRFLFDLVE
jgi:hypothetical protein